MRLHDVSTADTTAEDRGAPVRPPPRAGVSIKAAMIVPGLGVLILVVFIGASFLTSNPVQRPNTTARSFTVRGTPLRAEPAARTLQVITVSGQPPGNIVNAVSIPQGATRVSFQNNTEAAQQYDAQVTLTTDASQGAVVNFYSKDLKQQGWQNLSTAPADHNPGALEVLAKKAGSDGFYWQIGVVVSATTFGAGAPPAGATRFTLELFQQPDPA
jgi:hypothetical protein